MKHRVLEDFVASISVISHRSVAHELGLLQEWADARGYSITRFFREDEWNEEEILSADLVVAMGSPHSVATGHVHSSAAREIELMQRRIARKEPLFGICFGAQALAVALGGEVSRRQSANTGFKKITLHGDSIDAGGWALWHEDMVEPSSLQHLSGVEVVGTDAGAVIAFRQGSAWGVQFHPEVEGEGLGRMLSAIGIPESEWKETVESMKADYFRLRDRSFGLFDLVAGEVTP